MDPLVQMIVDILRKGKETEALNRGGPTVGASPMVPGMPRGIEPKHEGQDYDAIIANMSR